MHRNFQLFKISLRHLLNTEATCRELICDCYCYLLSLFSHSTLSLRSETLQWRCIHVFAGSEFYADGRVHIWRSGHTEGKVHRLSGRPVRSSMYHHLPGARGGTVWGPGVSDEEPRHDQHRHLWRDGLVRAENEEDERRSRLRPWYCAQRPSN